MFGLGNDSEHKLEENMEEIKNLVDDQAEQDELPEQTDQWSRQEFEDTDFSSEEFEMQGAEELMEDQPQQQDTAEQLQTEEEKPLEDEIESFEESLEEERSQTQQGGNSQRNGAQEMERQQSQPPREEQNYREESPRRESSATRGNVRADIPEPPETKKLDVPDIEKGPLFIRQNKFEKAVQLVYDMKYLTNEIESIVNTIEGDLQRDKQTENQLKEILGEFRDGRTEVERIVSVGEE